MTRVIALACALWAWGVRGGGASNCSGPTVHVKNGTYVGVHSETYNQDHFLSIPYAQPPVGSLRFRNPVSLNMSWSDARLVDHHRTACYGYGSDQWNYPVSEDCLHISIVRPSGYEHKKLPVAFWIHGGGFIQGSGIDQRYNSSFMVQNSVAIGMPIIVANVNYRLSAWGFLSGSEELRDGGALNLGLKDTRLAMQWVQENIEAFGGDPEQVTIFGESAGAGAVGFHLTAFGGRDDKLFRAAIMQSGNPVHYEPLQDPLGFRDEYNTIVNRTVCANATRTLECLRYLPVEQLNAAINTTSVVLNTTRFQPVVDGDFIQKRTSLQLAAGEFVHVPIISGANSDEGTAFSPQPVNSSEQFFSALTDGQRDDVPDDFANQLLAAYPDDLSVNVVANLGNNRPGLPFGAQWRRSASYFGDRLFIANRRLTCRTWAAAGVPAYCYRFNAIPAGLRPEIGVTHFQEIGFVWLNLEGVGYAPVAVSPFANKTEEYRQLARFMDSTWVSFVHDVDPNSWRETGRWNGNETLWPRYRVEDPMNYVFDANVSSYAEADTYRKEGMDLIIDHADDVYNR